MLGQNGINIRTLSFADTSDFGILKGINVEYMYAFFEQPQNKALLIFRFENPDEAVTILLGNGLNVAGEEILDVK